MTVLTRFIISVVLSLPLLANMILMPFGGHLPGGEWTQLVLTTLIMLISAKPFIHTSWAAFKNHHANMDTLVAIGTTTAYVYSLFAMATNRPVFFESAAFVTTFVLLGQVFEERMRNNASDAVAKLGNLQAKAATVIKDGQPIRIPLAEVQVGDLIQVKPGEKIAVDGTVVDGTSTVNEAMVTGESMPVTKQAGDKVIGATINQTGTLTFKADKVGDDTLLAQIVELVKKAQNSHAPIQKLTDQVSDIFVPVVLIVAILTFEIWYNFLHVSFATALIYAVAVVVIACPCALGLATPTALMVGTGRSAKLGILIKNGDVLEAVNRVKTVAFDKTGTITTGQPQVVDVIGDRQVVLGLAATLEAKSEHPLAQAILAANDRSSDLTVTNFQAIQGQGVTGTVNGQPTWVGSPTLMAQPFPEKWQSEMDRLTGEAKTVVAVGQGDQVLGLIAIQDTPKVTSKAAIADLKQLGLSTVMVTGDNQAVAEAIAKEVGIDRVVANVLPADKAAVVEDLQKQGSVAFVGDGINDAPALTTADVGIAMGSGTDIAIDAGGIVLVKNDLRDVPLAIELSKKTFNRIKLNLFWAFIYNVIGLPIAAGLFVGVGLALSPELAGLAMAFSSLSVVTSSVLLNRTPLKTERQVVMN
ncbi:copper-translocating P-type ATPase [Lactobacillus alvi]|uniref:P-type Cu(+) transporter n=1 Tax=Limosilactobacillus alvi TaxID=990412 RepID=A0ABS2ENE5_9LACO|nr:copper-translocating P-type ATPase [Limosilactobacillus alvi]MBM6754024.1 copper-translocating P-type ATPase [Limosilactobacillus alvi]